MLTYNLDNRQASYFASLKTGDEMVIVVPLKEQPPEGCKLFACGTEEVMFIRQLNPFSGYEQYRYILPYPLGARMGLRETWVSYVPLMRPRKTVYKSSFTEESLKQLQNSIVPITFKWRSAQCMPHDAIRYWGIVEDARVDRVQVTTLGEIKLMFGLEDKTFNEKNWKYAENIFITWFNRRYKGGWLKKPWCEIMTVRKE